VAADAFYAALAARGMAYGPAFQAIAALWAGQGEAIARLGARMAAGFHVDPAILDGALQTLGAALATTGADEVRLPVHLGRLAVRPGAAAAPAWAHARLRAAPDGADVRGDVTLFDDAGRAVAALEDVTLRAVDAATLRALDAARVQRHAYALRWQPAPATATAPLTGQRWAIVADDGGAGARLAPRLEARGAIVVGTDELAACDGVVVLTALDADGLGVDAALEAACARALAIVQALAGAPRPPRLVLATRGAVRTGDAQGAVSPLQASLWGLGRTVAVEHPELRGLLVDVDPRHPERTPDEIADAIAAADGEGQVAYRDGVRLVARLQRAAAARARTAAVRADASYLITGGLGALGLHAARELVALGARHLVLLSRRGPDAGAAAAIAALEAAGASVRCAQADVADRAALAGVLAGIAPPLAGVVHAAGVLDDGVLRNQSWDRFARVLSAKVAGALHLRALTRRAPLDFTVHFSSTAGLFGAAGQGNYAAANAVLDALAELDRADGRPTTSIAWGAWAGGGMASRADSARAGGPFAALEPDEGRAALGTLLGAHAPATVAIAKVRWQRLARALPADRRPRWLEAITGAAAAPAGADLARALAGLDPAERAARIAADLRAELRRALGLADDEPLAGDEELSALGVDSLLAIEVPQVLASRFGLSFPSTLLHEHRTLDALTAHIAGRLGSGAAATAVAPAVLVLKRASARPPLVCLGGAPGDALYLGALARHLPPEQPLYALQAPGLDGRIPPLATIEEIAAHHLAELRAERVDRAGPWLLAGHSFGGFVAFEMARQLRAAGEPVGLVALLDSVGVDWNDAELPFRDDWVAGELARVLFYTVGDRHPGLAWDDLAALPPAERVLRLVGSGEASEVARPLAARLVAVMKANLEAMVRYRPGVVDADLHLFRAREQLDGVLTGQFTVSDAPDLGWGAHSGGAVHVHPVAGNHFSMMGEPHVRALAAAVSSVLDRLLPREARA